MQQALTESVPERFELVPDLAGIAVTEANFNWRIWQSVYPTDEMPKRAFNQLLLFRDYPCFMGFGFDYSVFRRLKRAHLPEIWCWLRKFDAPSDPKFLNAELKKFIKSLNEKSEKEDHSSINNLSLCSKLMTLWRPDEHYMMDSMNRLGLAFVFRNTEAFGYKFSSATDKNYDRLKKAFDEILRREELFERFDELLTIPDKEIARRRFLDAYFVNLGKLHAKDESKP